MQHMRWGGGGGGNFPKVVIQVKFGKQIMYIYFFIKCLPSVHFVGSHILPRYIGFTELFFFNR